ncbi:MAG: hypothetical protein JXA78_13325 [Anaerolineales bacterium]|nr:hypothetical protein [Anaerolineales bacterium]
MDDMPMQDFTHASIETRDGTLFEARHSGLYRSQDGGKTWQYAYESLGGGEPIPTHAVVLSPEFESDGKVFAGVPGGVLVSENRGQDWVFARFLDPPPTVTALAISPAFPDDAALLAATLEDGVFLSLDGGRSWQAWNFGLLDWNVYCLALSPGFVQDRAVFIGAETGLFRSTNGGRSWRELPFPAGAAPLVQITLSPAFSQDGVITVETEEAGSYRSTDGGLTWAQLSEV